jgi:hypothetical protein
MIAGVKRIVCMAEARASPHMTFCLHGVCAQACIREIFSRHFLLLLCFGACSHAPATPTTLLTRCFHATFGGTRLERSPIRSRPCRMPPRATGNRRGQSGVHRFHRGNEQGTTMAASSATLSLEILTWEILQSRHLQRLQSGWPHSLRWPTLAQIGRCDGCAITVGIASTLTTASRTHCANTLFASKSIHHCCSIHSIKFFFSRHKRIPSHSRTTSSDCRPFWASTNNSTIGTVTCSSRSC